MGLEAHDCSECLELWSFVKRMVFIYIPPPKTSNLTTTPPNNLTEMLITSGTLPETTIPTLATASPLKSTSTESITMPGKFVPDFLTPEFCNFLNDDLYKVTDEFYDSGDFSIVYKITSQYIGIPLTQLVAKATNFCEIPPFNLTTNGTDIVPELGLDDFENQVDKPCTALQVTSRLLSNLLNKSKKE